LNIVTRDSLQALVDNERTRKDAIGRALVILLKNQTQSEATSNNTTDHNGVGFAPMDAYSGSLTAKTYIKTKTLRDWQIEKWYKKGKTGYSRIVKYWRQIDVAAQQKQQQLVA
jgi:hypothetical protein